MTLDVDNRPFNFSSRKTLGQCHTEQDVLVTLTRTRWGSPIVAANFAKTRLEAIRQDALKIAAPKFDPQAKPKIADSQMDPPEPELQPEAAIIEVIERQAPIEGGGGIVKPNEIRINGTPVAVPRDNFIEIEGLEYDPEAMQRDGLIVKLRLYARRVVIGEPIR